MPAAKLDDQGQSGSDQQTEARLPGWAERQSPALLAAFLYLAVVVSMVAISASVYQAYDLENLRSDHRLMRARLDAARRECMMRDLALARPSGGPRVETVEVAGYVAGKTLCYNRGETINIEPSGTIQLGKIVGSTTPMGRPSGFLGLPVDVYSIDRAINHGGLLCHLSNENEWRMCGNGQAIHANAPGCVAFDVNDLVQFNNVGSFSVRVSFTPGPAELGGAR